MIDKLTVKYHSEFAGVLSQTPNNRNLTSIDQLCIVGNGWQNIGTHQLRTVAEKGFQSIERTAGYRSGLLLYNSRNSGRCHPKAVFSDNEGHRLVKFGYTYYPEYICLQEFPYHFSDN